MDEMQKNIKIRSHAIACKFVIVALIIWTIYELYYAYTNNIMVYSIPSILLLCTMLVQNFSSLILKRKMILDDEEYKEPNKILWNVILIIVLIILVFILGNYFVTSRIL